MLNQRRLLAEAVERRSERCWDGFQGQVHSMVIVVFLGLRLAVLQRVVRVKGWKSRPDHVHDHRQPQLESVALDDKSLGLLYTLGTRSAL